MIISARATWGQYRMQRTLKCEDVADGRGRTREQAEKDPDFCREVFKFLQAQNP